MFLKSLSAFLAQHAIQGKVLVGVSGGADSVALLRGLQSLAGEHELQLLAAHFDHAWRPESSKDADWVRTLCDGLGIPGFVERNRDAVSGNPSEEAARELRYEFLNRVAEEQDCPWVAVAHTADDQVETILHQLLRGSGLRGLSGMPEQRALSATRQRMLIRPLLDLRREDVVHYLRSMGQSFRVDPTNADDRWTRNRLRHEVLPLLREAVNSGVDEALLRLRAQARDVQSALGVLAGELLAESLLEQQPEGVRLRSERLAGRPVALVREMFVVLWVQQDWPRQGLGFSHLQALAELSSDPQSRRFSLPGGIEALSRKGVIELRREPPIPD